MDSRGCFLAESIYCEKGVIRNPYRLRSIDDDQVEVYAA